MSLLKIVTNIGGVLLAAGNPCGRLPIVVIRTMHNSCEELGNERPINRWQILSSKIHHHLVDAVMYGLQFLFQLRLVEKGVKAVGHRHSLHVPQTRLVAAYFHSFVTTLFQRLDERRKGAGTVFHRHRLIEHWEQTCLIHKFAVARMAVFSLRNHVQAHEIARRVGGKGVKHGSYGFSVNVEIYRPSVERLHHDENKIWILNYGGIRVVGISWAVLFNEILGLLHLLVAHTRINAVNQVEDGIAHHAVVHDVVEVAPA